VRQTGKKRAVLTWNSEPISRSSLRYLADGTPVITLQKLPKPQEVALTWEEAHHAARIVSAKNGRTAWVRLGEKHVAISIGSQRMRAWQGPLLVLDTHVSTGRLHKPTPRGHFTAGPTKAPLLLSINTQRADALSVQVHGEVYILGLHRSRAVPPPTAAYESRLRAATPPTGSTSG